jgi:hypothetical protein
MLEWDEKLIVIDAKERRHGYVLVEAECAQSLGSEIVRKVSTMSDKKHLRCTNICIRHAVVLSSKITKY